MKLKLYLEYCLYCSAGGTLSGPLSHGKMTTNNGLSGFYRLNLLLQQSVKCQCWLVGEPPTCLTPWQLSEYSFIWCHPLQQNDERGQHVIVDKCVMSIQAAFSSAEEKKASAIRTTNGQSRCMFMPDVSCQLWCDPITQDWCLYQMYPGLKFSLVRFFMIVDCFDTSPNNLDCGSCTIMCD